jgi:hypothetical protein
MGLTDKLRDLDQKFLPGTREPDEDAEAYLRRVAASRAITPAQAGDVMFALREFLGVEPSDAQTDEDGEEEEGGDEEGGEDGSDDTDSDESSESDSTESDHESGEDGSEDGGSNDGEKESEEDEG